MSFESNSFPFRREDFTYEEILSFLAGEGYAVKETNRLAGEEDIPEDWPVRGHIIEGYDVSISPEYNHPQYGLIGQIACAKAKFARYSDIENRKLYNKLKKKFGAKLT